MRILIVGASRGLGKAFMEGLGQHGDRLIGVSRNKPADLAMVDASVVVDWIETDLSDPLNATKDIERSVQAGLDVIIWNVGIWEDHAFEDNYSFLADRDEQIMEMVSVNITATILGLKRLIPILLDSGHPRLILTGSTSGLPNNGQAEVTFTACKFALTGIANALRESFRDSRLGVTCLQLGYLNTEDSLSVPIDQASARGNGAMVPVHDVVTMTRAILSLSPASLAREITLPALMDQRF